jgi:predicted anti-sigma-YlaC factor YlaD
MKSEHITDLLDSEKVSRLSSAELSTVHAHIATCADCKLAFDAATASEAMLRTRAAQAIEPPQFFSTRVMAAVRERRLESEQLSIWGLWRTARGLITAMAALVIILGGFTIADTISQSGTVNQPLASSGSYSTEQVLFQEGYQNVNYDPTNGQVYQTVFGPEETDAEY